MKIISLYILLAVGMSANAQNLFSWGTGCIKAGLEYKYIIPNSQGGVLAFAHKQQLSNWYFRPQFVQNNGEEFKGRALYSNEAESVIISLDSSGQVQWAKSIPHRAAKVHAIAKGKGSSFHLIVNVLTWNYNNDNQPFGYLPSLSNEKLIPGFYIVRLSEEGELIQQTLISDIEQAGDLMITDFQTYKNDRFVISGSKKASGKLTSNQADTVYHGCGEFIMMVNKEGQPLWSQTISQRRQKCGSGHSITRQMDIAPNGTIYLGGTMIMGGIFSNGMQMLTPKKYNIKYHSEIETFVAAFTENGTMKWVRSGGCISEFNRLKATNKGVYVGHVIHGHQSFGRPCEYEGKSSLVLTFLNRKGKAKWHITSNMKHIKSMAISAGNDLILAGNYKRGYRNADTLGRFLNHNTPKRYSSTSFFAKVNSRGKVLTFIPKYFGATKTPVSLCVNKKGAVFVALEVFCTLSMNLQIKDDGLPPMECRASNAVLGRLNLY